MNIIKPKKLKKGDTIGILAVSGRIKEYENIENAKKFLLEQGYNVVISKTCETSHEYQAGKNDEDCVNALHNFFLNPKIEAILCARGGYGTLKLLEKIDWEIIKNNPKIFAGYSDITILLNMIYKKTGLITFHSPMANGDFGKEINNYTKESFFNCLKDATSEIKADGEIYYEGRTEGILWGGNLSSLVSLCGIDFIPNEELILFLEDLNEPTYKIDKMLTQLFNIEEIRKNVRGIAIGEFKDCDKRELKNLLKEFTNKHKIPMCDGFKITHSKIKDTIPVGIKATLNSNNRTIELKEKIFYN